MALNWNLTNIHDYKNVCWTKDEDGNDKLNVETEALIWLTIAIGMGKITEDNAAEFYSRISFYEKVFGSMMSKFENGERVSVYITPEIVHKHIGLGTNVSKETDASFRNRVYTNFLREQKSMYSRKTKVSDD